MSSSRMARKNKRKHCRTDNEAISNKIFLSDDLQKDLDEFHNCERATLELHKSKLLIELEVFKQYRPQIHAKQENMHLKILLLECHQKKLTEEIRLLRTELNDVFPALEIKQEEKGNSENITRENVAEEKSTSEENNTDISHDQIGGSCNLTVDNIRSVDKINSNYTKVNKAANLLKLNKYFKGVKVKIVNFVLAKHGEDVLIEAIKRITIQTAKSISDKNTEVLNVYLMNSKKITIHSIHSASLNKSLFISKRHYSTKWKRKPDNYITETVQPVLDDDEEVVSATPLVFLKPRSDRQDVCQSKKFYIGLLHTLTVNEHFELVSENPFEIRPLNGDVVFAKHYMDLLQPIILEALKSREKNNDGALSIPNISILTTSGIKLNPRLKGASKISPQLMYKINDNEVSPQSENNSGTLMTIDLTEPVEKQVVPVKLSTSPHTHFTDEYSAIPKDISDVTPFTRTESLDTYEISDGE